MYTMAIHLQQSLTTTICTVSLSETTDDGATEHLASAATHSALFSALDEDPLWVFCEQARDAVVKALSSGENEVWAIARNHDRLDGGWRGARNPDSPNEERS